MGCNKGGIIFRKCKIKLCLHFSYLLYGHWFGKLNKQALVVDVFFKGADHIDYFTHRYKQKYSFSTVSGNKDCYILELKLF